MNTTPDQNRPDPGQEPKTLRPESLAVTTGRPERVVDAPLNQAPVFASTYVGTPQVGGGEMGYGRYGNPTWPSGRWRVAGR
jgi:cystathionine gamma-synthase